MQNALIDFTEKLVPISDFSQGKASKIFSDVYENDNEYVVIKNNRPIAVVMSISEYKSNLESLKRTEAILEKLEELKLLKAANEHEDDNSSDFTEFIAQQGYSFEALERLADNIEIE